MSSDIDVRLKLAGKEAAADIRDVRKALDDVETAEGDVESAGKIMARALSQAADDIEADLKATSSAADALGAALGPELANKLGRSGIEDMVVKLKKIGLTSDEIEADVDQLAASIKRLDDVGRNLDGPKQGLDDVESSARKTGDGIHHMAGEADNSRSVMANMVGNSVQDVANLGGVAGTAGMALGQLGEYAAEGNIKLSNLAKVAGPMALVTVAAMGIQRTLGEIAATKAFNKKQVDDWSASLREGKTELDALNESLDKAGKIEFRFMGDTKDLVPILAEAGITADEFTKAVSGTKDELWTFVQRAKDAGVAGEDLMQVTIASTEYHKNLGDAVEKTGQQTKVFGDKAAEAARGTDVIAAAAKGAAGSLAKLQTATDDTAGAVDDLTDSLSDADLAYQKLTGKLDEEDAWQKVTESIMTFAGTLDPTAQDVRNLTRDIADYVNETSTIPDQKKTMILAQLDAGQIAAAENALAILTRNRSINIDLIGKGAAGFGDGKKPFAQGGHTPGGRIRVGEAGPEDIDVPAGSYVTPNDQISNGGGNVYVTQVLPAGTRMDDLIVSAQRRRRRRNGY